MIERFNFYDVYGYLIPGAFWLALMWLPFGLRSGFPSWTATEITVVGLLGSYIAGHLLYGMARFFFSSKVEDEQGRERLLSSVVLDQDNHVLSASVKTRLAEQVNRRFGIDVSDLAQRGDAFFLCRSALAQAKASSYVEQYQGMNSLTRGLATGAIFAVAFYLGWMAATCFSSSGVVWTDRFSACAGAVIALAPLVVIVSLDFAAKRLLAGIKRKPEERAQGKMEASASAERPSPRTSHRHWGVIGNLLKRAEGITFALVLAAIGYFVGQSYPLSGSQALRLAVIGAILLITSRRLAIAAKSFNESLAVAVYRDFIVLAAAQQAEPVRTGDRREA
jgi:hypothetical protein